MCLVIPKRIVAILDANEPTVVVDGPGGREEVSAALVSGTSDLLGRWAVVHAGFILSFLAEDDARSRLAVLAAMDSVLVDDDALRPGWEVAAGGKVLA